MASSSSHFEYDVFLSFRGYTRFEFTDTLYHALIKARIETFRDTEGLKTGEELEGSLVEAIERSRMSILVLCDKYPTSRWCLDELVKIMECSNNGKTRPVLPIYFHVLRSDVQYQKNSYGTAMIDQEKGRYKHRVEAWRSALSAVGTIYGQNISQLTPWGMVMDKIVEEVTKRLPPLPLHIDRPLGCDSELEEAKSLLQIDSHATCFMLVIHGEREISKFVAQLYNKIRPHFVAASFLSKVSEKANESGFGLEILQITLLSEMIGKVKTKIGSTFKGSSEIKRRLDQKRVLLILDDVDSIQQLNSLAGGTDWFGPGSRIIITTKNENGLEDEHLSNNGPNMVMKHYIYKESGSTVKEENVVGLVKDFKIVVNQLKEEGSPENVVSIVGMGGLGKTTLARQIYNNGEVKKIFPCRAWATVSKDFREKEVFKSLLNCLKPSTCKSKNEDSRSDKEELKQKVIKYLEGKKYLVVLDDVWDTNNPWGVLKDCFPDNKNGSMILVTTRDDRVANASESKVPHHTLSFMDKEESWELFHNEVFRRKKCPRELEPIGRSIAESCNGLPLVIKTTAGVVAKWERSVDAWEKVKNLIPHWSVAEDKEGEKMMERLKFSYDDLPSKMKPCFLYLGVFPEDKKIRARDLIRLWIAERFIEPIIQGGRSKVAPPQPEDIGEQYLKELVDRNLVQVASRTSDGKGVKTCQIHDLFRKLCISESGRNSNARDLSFSCNDELYACSATCNESRTCSLFFFGDAYTWSSHIPAEESFRVHVLYFSSFKFNVAEEEDINRLIHLRYFRVGLCFITNLDRRINKLETLERMNELETLHLLEHKVFDIRTADIKQLKHLRSVARVKLLADKEEKGERGIMQNLQTLYHVNLDSQIEFMLKNGYFPNLTTLGLDLSFFQKKGTEALNLHCLKSLNKLKLTFYDRDTNLSLDAIVFPPNLTKITLSNSALNSADMNALGQIASLQILKLFVVNCTHEEILDFGRESSFPQLQVLIITDVSVKHLTMEDGALPCLRRVVICECPYLEKVPEQMRSLGSNFDYVQYEYPDSDSDYDSYRYDDDYDSE